MTNREMVNYQKRDFFRFFFFPFTINCVLQEQEKCLLNICFTLFVANNAYKSYHRAKSVACLALYSRKLFLITLLLLNKKWVGYLSPSKFVDDIRTSHGITLTTTKLIDVYSLSYVFVCHRCRLK